MINHRFLYDIVYRVENKETEENTTTYLDFLVATNMELFFYFLVLLCCFEGEIKTQKEILEILDLSSSAISISRDKIMKKL